MGEVSIKYANVTVDHAGKNMRLPPRLGPNNQCRHRVSLIKVWVIKRLRNSTTPRILSMFCYIDSFIMKLIYYGDDIPAIKIRNPKSEI